MLRLNFFYSRDSRALRVPILCTPCFRAVRSLLHLAVLLYLFELSAWKTALSSLSSLSLTPSPVTVVVIGACGAGQVTYFRHDATFCYVANPENKKKVIQQGDSWFDESTNSVVEKCVSRVASPRAFSTASHVSILVYSHGSGCEGIFVRFLAIYTWTIQTLYANLASATRCLIFGNPAVGSW
jgi:hypothetical protein